MSGFRMHDYEVDTGCGLVRRLLGSQFPQWADLRLEPVASTGTVNAIYRLGHEMVVRLPRVHHWAADIDTELTCLPRLARELPLAVPEPVGFGHPGLGYPFSWAIYRWIPGEPWAADKVDDLHRAVTDLAKFVTALHHVDAVGAPVSRHGEPLQSQNPATRAAVQALTGTVESDWCTAVWEESLAAPPWERQAVWIHGDLLPANILVRDGRVSAVIDFGLAGIGDPAADMIPAWTLFGPLERDAFRSALGVDDATWLRGRGWALSIALQIIPYYSKTNPTFVDMAKRVLDQIRHDH